jgi:hypothetical protein
MSFLKLIRIATLAGLIVGSAIRPGCLLQETFSPTGGNAFYTYWHAGHFIREGKDYYKSFINNELPSVLVRYLDKKVESLDGIIFPGLVPAPASTAPGIYSPGTTRFFFAGGKGHMRGSLSLINPIRIKSSRENPNLCVSPNPILGRAG